MPTTLFLWHLAEEVEHKSSASDVYEAVDGSKLRYAFAMVLGTVLLGWFAWLAALVMLRDDGRLFRPVSHWRLFRWSLSLAFELFPSMLVSALPGHRPADFADPILLTTWLRQYDPATASRCRCGRRRTARAERRPRRHGRLVVVATDAPRRVGYLAPMQSELKPLARHLGLRVAPRRG